MEIRVNAYVIRRGKDMKTNQTFPSQAVKWLKSMKAIWQKQQIPLASSLFVTGPSPFLFFVLNISEFVSFYPTAQEVLSSSTCHISLGLQLLFFYHVLASNFSTVVIFLK